MYLHGREGKEGENRRRRIIIRSSDCSPHMRSVPLITTTRTTVEDISDSPIVSPASITANIPINAITSFCKDGRKISVGDCALFKPPQDAPPFIGLIRSLTYSKENNLQLGVNWLYRPPEVKLGKGILLEAAPNELFYSFHKDEIPAASLLHPCKVAFLPKDVELPTGIPSFLCRRVYDIANKSLWWLTEQDYIDERQEEVDKLLDKTRIEMDAVLQPGVRSPKPTIVVATGQLKPGSDNLQNTASSIPSQTKGKKREWGDHLTDPVKRERLVKTDDSDSGMVRAENSLRSEIAKITEEGGLVDSESVEKLVQLMQPDRIDKKIDLISRSMLAGVIAATDRFDCLSRFVQLKGLPVLDEWLQDVQKRKIGDGSSSKDGDKSSEEFLLVLLRALDKLPVNLNALQTSNIGRSVNHLRSHKNLEIQKKARSLVDTWKKRVEAEMNVIDAKSASWPSKSRLLEGHGARNSGGSGDIALKSSVIQLSTPKLVSIKGSQGETTTKSASSSPGSVKSATSPTSGKEGHLRTTAGGTSDVPLSMREDKSSSSSQSHNYNQSFSGKEDARSSTTGSMTVNKISSGSSRHRKSTTSFHGTSVSGRPKETGSSRNSSIGRNSTQEKVSQSVVMGEKTLDVPATDGSSHKLIVKIPNLGRSPAQRNGGGSFDDPSMMSSRASSPVLSDRHEQSDSNSKEKCDTSQAAVTPDVNAESWQSNDTKDLQTGSDEGDGSPAGLPEEEHSRTVGDTGKTSEASKVASSSSSRNVVKSELYESSFNSMYALIESCAKYAETSPSMSVRDDIGMNLLACVAAGEMCKSELISTTDFPQGSTPTIEEICMGGDAKPKPSPCDNYEQDRFQNTGSSGGDEQGIPAIGTWSKDGIPLTKQSSMESSGYRKPTSTLSEETLEAPVHDSSVVTAKSDDTVHSNSVSHNGKLAEERDGDESKQSHKAGVCNTAKTGSVPDAKLQRTGSLLTEAVASNGLSSTEDVKQKTGSSSSIPLKESNSKKEVNENLKTLPDVERKPILMADGKATQPTISGNDLVPENFGEGKVGEADQDCSISCFNQSVGQKFKNETSKSSASDSQSSSADKRSDCTKTNVQNKLVSESCSTASSTQDKSSAYPSQDTDGDVDLKASKLSDAEADKTEECPSTVADTTVSAGVPSDINPKMKFDLNEGLNGDDGKFGEPISFSASGNVHVVNTLSSSISSSAGSIPASITVAAAAKGPFVPPVDLLRSKGELGWKGSAATSAFRPAEPRKVLQLPLGPKIASPSDESTSRPCRPPLDIDLNVPDQRLLEDLACRDSTAEVGSSSDHLGNNQKSRNDFTGSAPGCSFGGLDLDLNRVDDANDMMQFPASSSRRLEAPIVPVKSVSSSSLPASEVRRDFDLNNGPGVDDAGAEQSSFHLQGWGSNHVLHPQASVVGTKPTSLESGSFSSWFPPGNSYSSVTIPSVLHDRGEQAFPIIPPGLRQRILGPPGGNLFTPDIYRGSVLSSSPAVHFPSSPFPYQMFPFGTTMPLPSATFSVGSASYMDSTSAGRLFAPAVNSQFLAPVGSVTSQYPRPFMVSLSDGVTNGSVENTRKWSRQGFDLNAGPGVLEIEGREEILSQRQLLTASSQALAEEQARIYSAGGGVLKRKEPEGGWDSESFRYKQPWQ